jgi:hypothetical protein
MIIMIMMHHDHQQLLETPHRQSGGGRRRKTNVSSWSSSRGAQMLSSGPLDSLIRWLRREDARKTNDDGAGEGTPLLSSDTARADASFSAGMAANEAAVKERIVVATAALCCT